MKKIYTLSFLFLSLAAAKAQNSVPNGNFESWITGTFDEPTNTTQSSNPASFYQFSTPFNCVKIADPQHGSFAVKLTTTTNGMDTIFGYFVNGNPNGPPSNYWPGGVPYNQQATGIRGYYKCNVGVGDTARVLAVFKKNAANIGVYIFSFYGVYNNYTLFSYNFSPPLPMAPDTVIFGAASSDFQNNNLNVPGSMIQLDSISFKAPSQPAGFDGDFENWQTRTAYLPTSWKCYADQSGTSVFRSTNFQAGAYALELKTFLGDNNGVPRAQGTMATTGYWSNSCSCWAGGAPYAVQVDTLLFYYKYAPAGNDSANVSIVFKKNGVTVMNMWQDLPASVNYQLVKIPFNVGQIPDTAIVMAQSSRWQDTLLNCVGSDLKIDEMHFKTQPLTTSIPLLWMNSGVKVYPNPSNGQFNLITGQDVLLTGETELNIYNELGEMVYDSRITSTNSLIDLTDHAKGIYFYRLINGDKLITTGKLVVQ